MVEDKAEACICSRHPDYSVLVPTRREGPRHGKSQTNACETP